MKRYFLLIIMISLVLGFVSCANDETRYEETHSETLKNVNSLSNSENLNYFSFKFPEGTEIVEADDKISFELPNGYLAYGISDNNVFSSFTKGSITCKCTSGGGGCSPGKIGGNVACVMTTCDSCTKSGSSYLDNERFNEIGIFNMNEPMAFFSNAMELNGRIMLPSKFYELDIIEEQLKELEENLLPAETTETKIVPISLYGYVVLIEVAKNIDTTSPYMITSSVKCGCNSTGKCPKDSKLIAVWCDASDCQSCTMTTSIFDYSTATGYTLEANTYSIMVY